MLLEQNITTKKPFLKNEKAKFKIPCNNPTALIKLGMVFQSKINLPVAPKKVTRKRLPAKTPILK